MLQSSDFVVSIFKPITSKFIYLIWFQKFQLYVVC